MSKKELENVLKQRFESGEYVRTVDGKIGTFVRYSLRPETSIFKSPFDCFIKVQGRKTNVQCCKEYIRKHGFDILDVIEKDDIVNGEIVVDIGENGLYLGIEDQCYSRIYIDKSEIKEILTHETYNKNKYIKE
jgi:hypothetical protein